jgi:iron complex transport system ATP-binding protein
MTGDSTNKLRCRGLTVAVPGRSLIEALDLALATGELVAILGPNGVGKSLALHTLAGMRTATAGTVALDGVDIASVPRQRLAARLALLPQYTEDIFPATAIDTALIGRHPHIGRLRWESAKDRSFALAALERVDLAGFADRDVLTLSGGERRRLAIAQVLTQDPQIYLLDEPTNHLDPQHQLDVLHLFRGKADDGRSILVSMHDVNLASRFADRCLLLYGDGRWDLGETSEILDAERLSALYGTAMDTVPWRDQTLFIASG